MKLTNLIFTVGLATGLAALVSCKDTRTEYGNPIRTEVKVTQKYKASWTQPIRAGRVVSVIAHPARYMTTIQSDGCTETINNRTVYNYLKQNKVETLEYQEIYDNTYGQKSGVAENETILLESEKIGCKFLLPN